ncbi:LysM peptidoglycan-binding domain-containing protein [Paenibacillus nicotianae]|uniref:LysM peptidoglycan-binding domain-containing protein n=1 Tax=Paenibacillus nicotianae TaxID=1526551 RepID=A0ABW4URX9_9BACL
MMNSKIQKVLLSTVVAASLGAVSVVAPLGAHQVSAATNDSNHEKNKDKAEKRADNAAYQAAVSAQVNAMFGSSNETTTAPEQEKTDAAKTPATETQAKTNVTVVVPQGASLTEIAAQYGVTVDELIAANNLLPAGYQLTIPQK